MLFNWGLNAKPRLSTTLDRLSYDKIVDVSGRVATTNNHLVFVLLSGIRREFLIVHDAFIQLTLPVSHSHSTVFSTSISTQNVQFLPRDALCALRGIATVSRPSVRPSVTLSYCGHNRLE